MGSGIGEKIGPLTSKAGLGKGRGSAGAQQVSEGKGWTGTVEEEGRERETEDGFRKRAFHTEMERYTQRQRGTETSKGDKRGKTEHSLNYFFFF